MDHLDTASGWQLRGVWHNRRLCIAAGERVHGPKRVKVHHDLETLTLTVPRMDARSYLRALKSFGQSVQRQAQTPVRFERVHDTLRHRVHLVPAHHYVAVCGHTSAAWGEVVAPGFLDCRGCIEAVAHGDRDPRERFSPAGRVRLFDSEFDVVA